MKSRLNKSLSKKTVIGTALALMLGSQGVYAGHTEAIHNTSTQEVNTANTKLVPYTPEQQQAYALGSTLAARLTHTLTYPTELGVEIDEDYVLQGINDAFADAILISPTASSELLEDLQETISQAAAKASDNGQENNNNAG